MRFISTIAFTVVCLAPSAWADVLGSASATQLFNEGRDALARKDFAVACEKFAESMRLDPKVGTILNLAQCEESRGHISRAIEHWKQAVDLAHSTSDSRESLARDHLGVVEKRIPKLRVDVEDAPPGTVMSRDGVAAKLGVLTAVDPGRHEIAVSAPGRKTATTTIVLSEGEERVVVLRTGLTLAPSSKVDPAPKNELGGRRTATWALASVGVVAVGIGAWFGFEAIRRNSDSKQFCDDNSACKPEGTTLRNDALRDARVSTIAFAFGAATLGGAVILWATEPRAASKVEVSVTPWSLRLGASW